MMRLLIVEDDSILADFLRSGLAQERYVVDVALDGEAGWRLAQDVPYDVIILDIGLPKIDGLTLCKQLRALRHDTLILMLTARQALEDKVQSFDLGADDYVVKPFMFDELRARLRALLRRRRVPQAAPLQVADLVLDPILHQVSRGGQIIEVTSKEYALLEFFMRHAGEVVSRAQLVEHLWSHHATISSNVIDVYVSYLRRKIDRPFTSPLLQTVRGVGYTLRQSAAPPY
ncbi:MAG: response regulator transcription factor [Candidatus Tectimicrobiota bacterium]